MALTDNIRAYYKLSDTSDSASTNTLTNTGSVSFAGTGIIGNAAGTFNTGSQRLSVASSMGYTSTSTNTWCFWVNATAKSGWAIDVSTSTGSGKRWILDMSDASGKLKLYSSGNSLLAGSTYSTGTFYFISVTHNSGNWEFFVNGTSQGTLTTGATTGDTDGFSIGNAYNSFGAPYNGLVDEYGIWDRVLTGTEITSLYNGGAGLQYPFVTTNIKTINGLAYASVKSVNGLAIASVKTFNGLA